MKLTSIKRQFTKIALSLILSLTFSANAFAAKHFTFKVPVRLYNINQSVPFISVDCYVSKVLLTDPHPASSANVVGRTKAKIIIPPSGNVNIAVTIAFNASSGRNPATAKSYTCYMVTDIGHSMSAATYVGGIHFKEKYRLKLGAPYVWKVKGNL